MQYYMRTRSCKFGASCKYHHPKQTGATDASPVSLNYYGYPLRPVCIFNVLNKTCFFFFFFNVGFCFFEYGNVLVWI